MEHGVHEDTRAAISRSAPHGALLFGGVCALTFLLALVGLVARSVDFLSSFWPVGPVLIGLMLRLPGWRRWPGWLGAVVGYLLAESLTAVRVVPAAWFAAADIAGVTVGFALLHHSSVAQQGLTTPYSILRLVLVCGAAGVTGALVSFIGKLVSGDAALHYPQLLFVSWMVNGVVILPVLLTARRDLRPTHPVGELPAWLRLPLWRHGLPLLSVPAACALGVWLGGVGALAFPIPALLWCAIAFDMFRAALITFAVCTWLLVGTSLGWIPWGVLGQGDISAVASLRLGVAFLALAPIAVASLNHAWRSAHDALEAESARDPLTGALRREAFVGRAQAQLETASSASVHAHAVAMIDIDHFKNVNDTHGHEAGDCVLREVAMAISHGVRPQDVFGRWGGEEFALFLPRLDVSQAKEVAERLRAEVAARRLDMGVAGNVSVTISIGVAGVPVEGGMADAMRAADRALYEAKAAGRNRVMQA